MLLLLACASKTAEPEAAETPVTPAVEASAPPDCDFSLLELEGPLGGALLDHVPNVNPDSTQAGDTTCMFYLVGWNNFLHLAQDVDGAPRMLSMAPWSYLELSDDEPEIRAYPTGTVPVNPTKVANFHGEAGDDWTLVARNGNPVIYDIRLNEPMYDYIADNRMYCPEVIALTDEDMDADAMDWAFPPNGVQETQSIEYKTSWLDFGSPADCPDTMFCQGSLGLVGMHLAQKTPGHGEWLWWSFEYAGNAPDCRSWVEGAEGVVMDAANPISSRDDWLFFDPMTFARGKARMEKPEGMSDGYWAETCLVPSEGDWHDGTPMSEVCAGTAEPPEHRAFCNQNPQVDPTKTAADSEYVSVNVCRVQALPDAADAQEKGQCALGGDAKAQFGQLACANADLKSQPLAPGVAPKWVANYVQVGAEWTAPGAPVTGLAQLMRQQDLTQRNKATSGPEVELGGFPFLANTTLETWMQKDLAVPTCSDGEADTVPALDCFSCHKPEREPGEDGRMNYSHLLDRLQVPNGGRCASE